MTSPAQERFKRAFLLLLVVFISGLFLLVIRRFLMTMLLAGIFAGLTRPLYLRLLRPLRGRRPLASFVTILLALLLVVVPLSGFLGIVVSQAISVSRSVQPLVQELEQPDELDRLLARLPFAAQIAPYREQIETKVGQLVGRIGAVVVNSVAALTRGTATFFLQLFVMLYAMFFFLIDGRKLLHRILYYAPLGHEEESVMVEKFVSVTRATLKGTLVIGLVQGGLAGAAFWVAGIGGWAFWATIMAVLSIIPGVGVALIWVPASIYLLATGHLVAGLALAAWCGLLVGTVDNLLRPRLIGRDTKMSDLLILLSTLGGILVFGAVGFVIGPIVAALFVTVWDIYGTTFADLLPATGLTAEIESGSP